MNCQLKDITVTARDGRVSHLDQVYIRGSHVRYFIVPDMLRSVPAHTTLAEYKANASAGMRQCSDLATSRVGVLDWLVAEQQSAGPEEVREEDGHEELISISEGQKK